MKALLRCPGTLPPRPDLFVLHIQGQSYGQNYGVAMGSPLSPVIADFCMEDYQKAVLESHSPPNPRCWFRYVDNNFVIWPHGPDKLKDFLHHLNSIYQSIQFTTETESEGHLPFLDLDFCRRPDGCLGHKAHTHPSLHHCQAPRTPIQ
jgi:hypothetical protein